MSTQHVADGGWTGRLGPVDLVVRPQLSTRPNGTMTIASITLPARVCNRNLPILAQGSYLLHGLSIAAVALTNRLAQHDLGKSARKRDWLRVGVVLRQARGAEDLVRRCERWSGAFARRVQNSTRREPSSAFGSPELPIRQGYEDGGPRAPGAEILGHRLGPNPALVLLGAWSSTDWSGTGMEPDLCIGRPVQARQGSEAKHWANHPAWVRFLCWGKRVSELGREVLQVQGGAKRPLSKGNALVDSAQSAHRTRREFIQI